MRAKARWALWVSVLSAACAAPGDSAAAAEVYEEFYVPALFGPWAERVVDAAGVRAGDRVLDVACGTGVVARAALARVGADGSVTGLDIDPGMLAVARRLEAAVDWRQGDAQELPFADGAFDVVTCQFGLMFFPDPAGALAEMRRVLAPGGRMVVAVWSTLDDTPGYRAFVDLLVRELGEDTAQLLRRPFALGDRSALERLCADAGVAAEVRTLDGAARFPSIRAWVETEVRGWFELTHDIDEESIEELVRAGERELAAWAAGDGRVEVPIRAHLVVASMPP